MESKRPGPPPAPAAAAPPVPTAARRPPPPPPPPATTTPSAAPATSSAGGSLLPPSTTRGKLDVAATALRLRDEQIQARVVYFGAEQQTNKELDAITEGVIAELKALQNAGAKSAAPAEDRSHAEIELIGNLRGLMEKLFSSRREGFLRRKIEDIQRRITTLFFNSELYRKIAAGGRAEPRTVSWPDQAVYYALERHKETLLAELRAMRFTDPSVLADAEEKLRGIEKGLRLEFLSRTTPELEKLLEIFREVLANFLLKDFREGLGEFCWEVIRESRAAQGKLYGYKLGPEAFGTFREAFDKKFLEKLVLNVQEPIVQRASGMRDLFRDETLRFVAAPQIFTEICASICNACYDYLHSEGFLELPAQWRAHLYKS